MKESKPEFVIKLYYSDNETDIKSILNKSVSFFIEKEVEKLCLQNSWLHTIAEHIIFPLLT